LQNLARVTFVTDIIAEFGRKICRVRGKGCATS